MILELAPACLRHRGTLLALVDRQERGPATERAVAHLSACRRCEDDLTRLALTIHALRRIGDAAASEAPSEAVWPRLRARLERSRQRARETSWRWRMNLSGLVAGTLIVGVLVGPLAIHISLGAAGGREPTGYSASEQDRYALLTEARFVDSARLGTLPTTRAAASTSSSGLRMYPDEIRPRGKEVASERPGGSPPDRS